MRVAIIGMGFIGKAQARMLAGHDLVTWDIADGTPYPYDAVHSCHFAVICAGTPALPGGSADLSGVMAAVAAVPGIVPVLIRSTVLPGTTDALAAGRPGLTAHAPEFMYEREGTVWSETTDVPFLILGGTPGAREFFAPMLAEVFPGKVYECSALEAELVKYTGNLYWAARVTFVNEMSRICETFGADWEEVRQGWLMHPWVSPQYTGMAGFGPGFGGRCWPKDLSALIAASTEAGYEPRFLEAVQEANARFRA